MGKRIFFWGLTSGLMAAVASYIWDRVYYFAMMTDYSKVVNMGSILASCMLGTMLAIVGFSILHKYLPAYRDVTFNFLLSILTIASLAAPLSIALPLDVDFPEFFPALALPMHFFPAMALFTLRPLFLKY